MSGAVIVFRATQPVTQSQLEHVRQVSDGVTKQLLKGETPIVILNDTVHAYYLKPGQSTTMLDAEAERIRRGEGEPREDDA